MARYRQAIEFLRRPLAAIYFVVGVFLLAAHSVTGSGNEALGKPRRSVGLTQLA